MEPYGYPCLRGRSHIQWLYNPDRIKYPMRRVEGTERGAGQWERISWDEAIEEVAAKFTEIQEKYGNEAVAWTYFTGTGSASVINGVMGMGVRFCNVAGMSLMDFGLDMAWGVGEGWVTGGLAVGGNGYQNLARAKTILIWGNNATESCMRTWRAIQKGKEAGATVVCIDPRYTTAAAKSDMFVPVFPGSDGALAMGIINYLIENDLCNRPYMVANSCAPFLVKEDGTYLHGAEVGMSNLTEEELAAGIYDPIVVWDLDSNAPSLETECDNPALEGSFSVKGISATTAYDKLKERAAKYTADYVSDLCQIDASWVATLGDLYAAGPVAVATQYGFDKYNNADVTAQAIATLETISGSFAVEGGGFGMFAEGPTLASMCIALCYPEESKGVPLPYSKMTDMIEGVFEGEQHQIKAFFVQNANMFSNNPDQRRTLERLLPNLEYIVVHDSNMNDTARYADIILPATHYLESEDLTTMTWINLMEKAVEPEFEVKSNYEVYRLLAEKMGFGDYFQMTEDEIIQSFFETNPQLGENGLTYEKLMEKKALLNVAPEFYTGVAPNVWGTQSGKLEFYNEAPAPRYDLGLNVDMTPYRLPDFEPPIEVWHDNALRKKYPLVYIQEHTRWRIHSSWYNAPWLRELDPYPVVKLSPKDAESRGIQEDDIVEVFNDRGSVTLHAAINNGLPEGMCNIPKGWQRDQFISGGYQELTSSAVNNRSMNANFFDVLVEIRKVEA